MNVKKLYKNKLIKLALILLIVFFVAGFYWLHILYVAHSTFDNYYTFRGCAELIEKTDTYGICKTSSGDTIKIVLYKGKWYLNGDLPYPGLNFL